MADSKYVTLVSKEGFEFVCLREATLVSPTMKGMLRGQFAEARTGRCTFPEMRYVFSAFNLLPSIPLCNDDTFAVFPDRPLSPLLSTLAVETGTRDRTA